MADPGRETELAEAYDAARPQLVRVAYAVTGSRVEAEDVVSECWLRLVRADAAASGPVLDVVAWSTVVVARAALDHLRSARHRREVYPGEWLPEPLVAAADDRVSLDESVSYALLVVLESLTPAERVAFVLHDLFAWPFDEVAALVGRTPAAVRQLAKRARDHVEERAPRRPVDARAHAALLDAFLAAAAGGSLPALVAVLDPDVVLVSDGGGVVSSARRPVVGADRVARFLLGIVAKTEPGDELRHVLVNGAPGLAVVHDGRTTSVFSITGRAGRVLRVDIVRAPDKLASVLA